MDYVRRIGYETDRLESTLERHITWYTHKNPNAGECPICAVFIVLRGLHREFEGMLGPDGDLPDGDVVPREEGIETLNNPSPVLDNHE